MKGQGVTIGISNAPGNRDKAWDIKAIEGSGFSDGQLMALRVYD
jgi:hypothetical protein